MSRTVNCIKLGKEAPGMVYPPYPNELGKKIVEIDARPSDCLALAAAHKRPVFVAKALFDQVDDMTEYLDKLNEGTGEQEA